MPIPRVFTQNYWVYSPVFVFASHAGLPTTNTKIRAFHFWSPVGSSFYRPIISSWSPPFPRFGPWMFYGIGNNLLFSILFSLAAGLISLPFSKRPVISKYVFGGLSLLGFIIAAMLPHYFINTQLTLGSDFFEYDTQEIENTIKSSGAYSPADSLLYILPFTCFLVLQRILNSKELSTTKSLIILGVVGGLVIGSSFCAPQAGSTTDAWSKNKSLAFYASALDHYTDQIQPQAPIEKRDVSVYFHKTGENTTFGSLIGKPNSTPINIRTIVVEGLGQTFLEGGLKSGLKWLYSFFRQTSPQEFIFQKHHK